MWLLTLELNGGLNQEIFRFLLLVFLLGSAAFGSNFRLKSYPLLVRASLYRGAADSNIVSSEEMEDSLLFTPAGIFLATIGGWLLNL